MYNHSPSNNLYVPLLPSGVSRVLVLVCYRFCAVFAFRVKCVLEFDAGERRAEAATLNSATKQRIRSSRSLVRKKKIPVHGGPIKYLHIDVW